MNKKILISCIIIIILIALGVGLFVIFSNKDSNNENQNVDNESLSTESNSNTQTEIANSKILVAVFSKTGENYNVGTVEKGNTMIMAENIANELGATLFEITPVTPYPDDYEEAKTVAQSELSSDARPEIKNEIDSFDDYDVIFIGYPIWYGDYPMIINTFLESYDFSGKTVIPFNTHEGSGNAGTFSKIKSKLSSATVLDGLSLKGTEAREDSSITDIKEWLSELGL